MGRLEVCGGRIAMGAHSSGMARYRWRRFGAAGDDSRTFWVVAAQRGSSSAIVAAMDSEAMERAERRRLQASQWPVRRYDLGREPLRDPLDRSTIDERIAMMWPLAKEAWSVAGKPIANYERKDMPGALVRRQR